jgi:hypothetical protein
MADLTSPGVQSGFADRYSAARPAMWGDDIDVPERNSYEPSSPAAFAPSARIATPGAEMSGFSRLPPSAVTGPRDEKPAI